MFPEPQIVIEIQKKKDVFIRKNGYHYGHREIIHFSISENKLISKYFVVSEAFYMYGKQVFIIIRY